MNEIWVQFATVVGPTAAVAVFALWLSYKSTMKLMEKLNQLEENNLAVAQALGEVTEALRGHNGKT